MIYFQHNPLFFCDERDTGYPDVIIIRTKVEDFFFHTGSIKKKEQWRKEIDSAFLNYQVLHKSQPSLRTINSTFNIQENNKAKWYVDGCFYFEDIYNDLINANHRVLISDWWFCPHLYLKRPKQGNEDSKIIEVLRTLVKKNKKIEIYIHMYREPTPLDLGSALTESEITEDKILNKNVRILRHPERGIAGAKLLWAHHEKICVIDDRIAYLGGIDLCYGRFDTHEHKLVDDDEKITFFPGPDFSNPRICEVIDMKKHEENQLDRKKPRMPWHDIALRLEGPSAQDVSLHFMDLVNWASRDSANFRRTNKKVLSQRIDYSMSVNQNNADVISPSAPDVEEIGESREIFQDFLAEERFVVDSTSQCQILRSVGQWSYGWLAKEDSILQTYLKLISESKHFVYIENQFFISSTAGPEVKNGIAQALVDRIKKAYDEDLENKRENPSFRVIVCMPLLPAFEGEVTETTAPVLKIQLYWEYMTIFKGNDSIFKQLAKVMPKPEDYISFYGLRTHGRIDGKPVTEIVYIHSKLMIVDDDIAIMGSANINDRSMAGDHDSEIACCIKDKSTVESKLNGNHFNKGLFAFTLRKEIFKEILGNNFGDLDDPLDKSFLNNLKSRAKKNTETYRKVFKCYPDDTFDSFDELNKKGNKIDPSEFSSLNEISGFIVEFPMKFLEKENLKPSPLSKEGLAPVELWV
jgi:phospholipase D1/2